MLLLFLLLLMHLYFNFYFFMNLMSEVRNLSFCASIFFLALFIHGAAIHQEYFNNCITVSPTIHLRFYPSTCLIN
jgi:hypothetical protein